MENTVKNTKYAENVVYLNDFNTLIKSAYELNQKAAAAKKAADAAKLALKNAMKAAGVDTIASDTIKTTLSKYTSTTLDTKTLKTDFPELWKEYGKKSTVEKITFKTL